ncbi:MAG: hypothetical protein AAFZ91_16420 [Pseudomonadota bacterium]
MSGRTKAYTMVGLVAAKCVALSGCQSLSLATAIAQYERTLDRYSQTDTTVTAVTETRHEDGREAALVSAFFGLDNGLPKRNTDRVACDGAGGADGMPVIFSHEVDVETLDPGDFKIATESGAIGEVTCLTLAPADDPGELRTALLAGNYGSAEDQPVTVEIVGNILSLDGSINFTGASIAATRLEVGPTLVWAERVPETDWALGESATTLPWGGGDKCPVGSAQVIRVTWDGGVTKPGGEPADFEEGQLYAIDVASEDGAKRTVTAVALADLKDGDNNHLLCLDTTDTVQSISFPAGYLTDPREDLNPDTKISVLN